MAITFHNTDNNPPDKKFVGTDCEYPFSTSDDEVDDFDNDLLAHLVKDVSEVDFDDMELDTRICDLMASIRKSKKHSKKHKKQKGSSNSKTKVSQ